MRIKVAIALVASLMFSSSILLADDFTAKWEEADLQRKQAAEMGYEWRDTRKLLKSAQKEADAGNSQKAMELIAQALEQSNDAIAQAQREKENWKARVPQ